MSVVHRCPSCGTTKGTSGECEACHEAQVRYFCTNHVPGLWLSASTCPRCGASFGVPARAAPATEPAAPVRTSSPVPPPAAASRAAPPRAPYSRALPPSVWGGRKRSPPASGGALEPGMSGMAILQKILEAAVRARYARVALARERRPRGRGAGGCLMRLLLGMLLVFLALASGLFVFGRALLPAYFP